MKKEKVFDDKCEGLYNELTGDGLKLVIAPVKIIMECLYWILEEDITADLYFIHVDKESNKQDAPYILYYYPGKIYGVEVFDCSVTDIDCPVYIYDMCSSKYLHYVDQKNTTPFCLESDAEETEYDTGKIEIKSESENNKVNKVAVNFKKDEEENPFYSFTEYKTDKHGNTMSYSFYSTDQKLVERMATQRINHRGKIGSIVMEDNK